MKQIDEIVRSFEQCNNCGGCKGCAYEDEESCADNLEEDVLEILRKVQGGKRMKITITTPDVKDMEKQLAEEKDRAEAWELRCGELEQELREAQETNTGLGEIIVARDSELRTFNKTVQKLEQELREAQDRIHEQDWTIAKYDDENRELKERLRKCEESPITVSLNEWASVIHENAVAHGWWAQGVCDGGDFRIDGDVDRPLPEILMLCVCELAESMEEYRDGKPLIYEGDTGKPEGIAVEMVDCIIRILDWMGHNGVDVDEMIRKKHAYNIGRPYRHGGKMA